MFRRLVIKLGTSTLTAGTPRIVPARLVDLVRQVADLRGGGHELVLVSSGAIAAGREGLNFPQLPREIPAKQMLAAVGQPRLMALYDQIFRLYGLTPAQVLLSRADLADRHRYLNSRNTFAALLAQGVIPIVNENDTVATEEIRVGDNDNLSAMVANLVDADLLVLLTDQAGLFTADPRIDPSAQLVSQVDTPEIAEALWLGAGDSRTGLGTGGMFTKMQAADLARRSGTTVVIAQGTVPDLLLRVAAEERLGTWFLPVTSAIEGRKRYILSGSKAMGMVTIDDGAVCALQRGGSLLPIGVTGVEGEFERGDTVRVVQSVSQREIARGIANYAATDVKRLSRKHSEEIERVLGYNYGDTVIHRNNLVLL